jgi:hypothetical protein
VVKDLFLRGKQYVVGTLLLWQRQSLSCGASGLSVGRLVSGRRFPVSDFGSGKLYGDRKTLHNLPQSRWLGQLFMGSVLPPIYGPMSRQLPTQPDQLMISILSFLGRKFLGELLLCKRVYSQWLNQRLRYLAITSPLS